MQDLGIPQKTIPILFEDNMSVVHSCKPGAKTVANKCGHLLRREQFILECARAGDIKVQHIKGLTNPADMLTKPLPGNQLEYLCSLINIAPRGGGSLGTRNDSQGLESTRKDSHVRSSQKPISELNRAGRMFKHATSLVRIRSSEQTRTREIPKQPSVRRKGNILR